MGKIAFYIQINHALLSVFVCVCVCISINIFPWYHFAAPPGYGEDYGTLSRMYASYGTNEDDYHSRRRSPSIDTEFRGMDSISSLALLCFASFFSCIIYYLI